MGINLKDILAEKFEIDLEVGDTILRGKFKNKPVVVKSFGTDDKGQPTVNGKKMLSFRIKKLMPKKGEVSEMKMVNKKTGKDITKYVIAYLEKKISKKEFEKLTGLKKDKLKVNEGRPMPTDSPNEFAYLDFKKWAYKKRGKIKKQMASLSPGNVNRALVAVWEMWDKMKNKGAYSRIKNIKKFGKILYKMMKKDRLVEKYNIRKSSCKQSDGDSGSYRLSYTTKKGKKRSACHTSKKKAQDQIKAIEAPPR